MADVNVIDWHVTPLRADRWYALWRPALERATAYGATSCTLTRAEDDHLHFRQTTTWEDRADFERYWSSDEVAQAREKAHDLFAKPLLPAWHMQLHAE